MKARPPVSQLKKSRFRFVVETFGELKKAVWPTRRETVRLTIIVTAICVAAGLVLGAFDYGFTELVSKVFLR